MYTSVSQIVMLTSHLGTENANFDPLYLGQSLRSAYEKIPGDADALVQGLHLWILTLPEH